QIAHIAAQRLHHPDAFVAENSALDHAAHRSPHEMQVGAADGRGGQADNGVGRRLDGGFGNLVETNVPDVMENHCFHISLLILSDLAETMATCRQPVLRGTGLAKPGFRVFDGWKPWRFDAQLRRSNSSRARPGISTSPLDGSVCGSSSWGRLVSARKRQLLRPGTSGRRKRTAAWCALRISNKVASAPLRRIPVDWARPSMSMP